MLYGIEKNTTDFTISEKYIMKAASEVGLLERNIEDFIADHPKTLFPNEEILVIAQSISYRNMADVLALDATGNLIIVEIKRDHSSRETVGQLLEYAAKMKDVTYDELNDISQKYKKWTSNNLYDAFKAFSDDEYIDKEKLGSKQRIIIVAPDSDEGLQRIVTWLRSYGVPIEFVPFSIFADEQGQPKIFDIKGVQDTPDSVVSSSTWKRHWIFNTNETYSPGAYEKMFERNVAAIYGYKNGPRNLQGSSVGDTILAYVNQQGLMAVGEVLDEEVVPGVGIFFDKETGQQVPDEYHIKVKWDIKKSPVTNGEAKKIGYNLPVRTVFGKLHNGDMAQKIVDELNKR
ncbi:hypothetical protein [Sporosarcina sp. E16_8]|uniref:hypothetical protein n=1 Tax=Sporosarcina sp. E16_8 TaxID=2789295 RepID=UPI001A9179C0|nr:hypothetical protein [Sporosarcina sp. E16_8]MBO0589052.1 hypothetical protein [Sporosarcina sp. E16_8]